MASIKAGSDPNVGRWVQSTDLRAIAVEAHMELFAHLEWGNRQDQERVNEIAKEAQRLLRRIGERNRRLEKLRAENQRLERLCVA